MLLVQSLWWSVLLHMFRSYGILIYCLLTLMLHVNRTACGSNHSLQCSQKHMMWASETVTSTTNACYEISNICITEPSRQVRWSQGTPLTILRSIVLIWGVQRIKQTHRPYTIQPQTRGGLLSCCWVLLLTGAALHSCCPTNGLRCEWDQPISSYYSSRPLF